MSSSPKRDWGAVIELALFQVVWLTSAIGAARGYVWPAIAAASLLAAYHVAVSTQRRSAIRTLAASGAVGAVAESLLVAGSLVQYAAPWPVMALAPAWIVSIWLAFGTTLERTTRILGKNSLLKACALGAVFGPPSYYAGERLGAVVIPDPALLSYLAFAVVWMVAYPALLALNRFGASARR